VRERARFLVRAQHLVRVELHSLLPLCVYSVAGSALNASFSGGSASRACRKLISRALMYNVADQRKGGHELAKVGDGLELCLLSSQSSGRFTQHWRTSSIADSPALHRSAVSLHMVDRASSSRKRGQQQAR
jgi:hypothetical protein